MTDGGDDPLPFEVFVCVGIHHQQPGLSSPFLYEGHHLCMSHALNAHPIYLMQTKAKVIGVGVFIIIFT